MYKLLLVIGAALLASVQAVDVINCGSCGTDLKVYVSCNSSLSDCELEAEKNYIFDVRFKALHSAQVIRATIGRYRESLEQLENLVLTDNRIPESCPIVKGEDYIFYQVLSVPKDVPRGRFQFIGRLVNENQQELACYTIEAVYVDYKNSTTDIL